MGVCLMYIHCHWFTNIQTQIQYLVTQQNIVFDLEVKSCPTFDDIFIQIDVAAVFRCKEDNESIEKFVYNISINQLNKQIKAAITERIRVLGKLKWCLSDSYSQKQDSLGGLSDQG